MSKDFIGEFTGSPIMDIDGTEIANDILSKAESGELTINDDYFKQFLCVIFAEGNFEFLRVLARNWYVDTRQEVILDFIDLVEKHTKEGEKELHEQAAEKKARILAKILEEL